MKRGLSRTAAVLLASGVLMDCRISQTTMAPSIPVVARTTASERQRFREELIREKIEGALQTSLTDRSEREWERAFWAMGLARYSSPATTGAMQRAFADPGGRSVAFQRAMMEAACAVYPAMFAKQMQRVMEATQNEKLFAMAAHYLLRQPSAYPFDILARMQQKFPAYETDPILRMLNVRLSQAMMDRPPWRPPVADLLAHSFVEEAPVLFSIQRRDRRYPGLAVLRDREGRFVRTDGDSLFCVSQLALSCADLPGYLTNGNTPQGVFSVQGFATVSNEFIGPTETIQLVLPCEVPPAVFFHATGPDTGAWVAEEYTKLLPESWKLQSEIHEAYYAGSAGRTEIIAHGTTVDPEFYRGEPFYPNTPTLGCLSAEERWSPESGVRIASDQQTLVDAMKRIGFEKGYLVVVELDSEQRAVSARDVLPLIYEAEQRQKGAK